MTEPMRPLSADETLRLLARALAPYLATELRNLDSLEREALAPDFDDRTCRRFVADLGDEVLPRAVTMFSILERDGVCDSLQLAAALGVTPRALSGRLTTPLKRRAKALQLPLPFDGGLGTEPYGGIPTPSPDMDPERTHWQDRHTIATRMLNALRDEIASRTNSIDHAREHRPHEAA